MPFIKLDTGILDSPLWVERDQRDVFLTALLMAVPREFSEPLEQMEPEPDSLNTTGFVVPAGWYGFCDRTGPSIVRRSLTDFDLGMEALHKLGLPDPQSHNTAFEGRRMVRVVGGYIILNYMAFQDRDHQVATRAKNLRERKIIGRDDQIRAQGGKCGCCEAPFERPYSKGVVWDHNHRTGLPRALVCPSCNAVIGLVENVLYTGSSSKSTNNAKAELCEAYLLRYGVT